MPTFINITLCTPRAFESHIFIGFYQPPFYNLQAFYGNTCLWHLTCHLQ